MTPYIPMLAEYQRHPGKNGEQNHRESACCQSGCDDFVHRPRIIDNLFATHLRHRLLDALERRIAGPSAQ